MLKADISFTKTALVPGATDFGYQAPGVYNDTKYVRNPFWTESE